VSSSAFQVLLPAAKAVITDGERGGTPAQSHGALQSGQLVRQSTGPGQSDGAEESSALPSGESIFGQFPVRVELPGRWRAVATRPTNERPACHPLGPRRQYRRRLGGPRGARPTATER